MNKYNLIREFFTTPEDAVRFFVQSQTMGIANEDMSCLATLEKESDEKWLYKVIWMPGDKWAGDYVKPFKPSLENIRKFNDGCAVLAGLLEKFIDTGDVTVITDAPNAFGDMTYKE